MLNIVAEWYRIHNAFKVLDKRFQNVDLISSAGTPAMNKLVDFSWWNQGVPFQNEHFWLLKH